jgi:GNAT superfamily N-acetyltransferase
VSRSSEGEVAWFWQRPRDMTFTLRFAQFQDTAELVSLRLALLREVHSLSDVAPSELTAALYAYFERTLATRSGTTVVAESGGHLIACGSLNPMQRLPSPRNLLGTDAYLTNMYTVPEWRGRGVGTAIVQRLISEARQQNAKRILLQATDAGRPVYRACGFQAKPDAMELSLL